MVKLFFIIAQIIVVTCFVFKDIEEQIRKETIEMQNDPRFQDFQETVKGLKNQLQLIIQQNEFVNKGAFSNLVDKINLKKKIQKKYQNKSVNQQLAQLEQLQDEHTQMDQLFKRLNDEFSEEQLRNTYNELDPNGNLTYKILEYKLTGKFDEQNDLIRKMDNIQEEIVKRIKEMKNARKFITEWLKVQSNLVQTNDEYLNFIKNNKPNQINQMIVDFQQKLITVNMELMELFKQQNLETQGVESQRQQRLIDRSIRMFEKNDIIT